MNLTRTEVIISCDRTVVAVAAIVAAIVAAVVAAVTAVTAAVRHSEKQRASEWLLKCARVHVNCHLYFQK